MGLCSCSFNGGTRASELEIDAVGFSCWMNRIHRLSCLRVRGGAPLFGRANRGNALVAFATVHLWEFGNMPKGKENHFASIKWSKQIEDE